ncbi:hypothetical protein LOC67_09625 [Stieleria sp. JC731]|uniref:hypothetical protein n=1 Tax=Pirellulaceae TaxID=2691357 RepID=UPI001E2A3FC1|nr:hypothetical protein [Stieleria sp. JC731]MCC9600824.1 hypothetical protein [Stieleria sp. JC731]
METFLQTCPNCQATLELPLEASGKRSSCPGCQIEFTAETVAGSSHQDPDRLDRLSDANVQSPMQESLEIDVANQRVSIESIFVGAQILLASCRRQIFVPSFCVGIIFVATVISPLIALNMFSRVNFNLALILAAALSPLFIAVACYGMTVALQLINRACDSSILGPQVDLVTLLKTSMKPSWRLLARVSLVMIVAFCFMAALIVATGLMIRSASSIGKIETALLLYALAFMLSVIAPITIATFLWPTLPLCLTSLGMGKLVHRSVKLAAAHLFNSFLIATAVSILFGFGISLLGLGLIVATPIAVSILVVGWRRTSGHPIHVLDEL